MRKLIVILFALFMVTAAVKAQVPWTTDTFSAGDTTATYSVSGATTVYFVVSDSSMSGTDTLSISFISPSATTNTLYSLVAVHDLAQTTQTTNVTVVSPGDATTRTYVLTAAMWGGPITGSFFIRRLNTRTGEAVYAPKTRLAFRYE